MPGLSRMRATRGALIDSASQPIRIFAVTGTGATARTTASATAAQRRAILEQRGAAVLRDDLVDRAAKVQVDEVRPHPVDDVLRRLRHVLRVPAEKLHADRALAFIEVEILAGAFVAAKDPSAETNSVTSTSAPRSLQSCRKILSDTPAIGAR